MISSLLTPTKKKKKTDGPKLTMPTNNLGCWAVPLTPASPTIPMAKPAARPARPTERPAPSWMKPV